MKLNKLLFLSYLLVFICDNAFSQLKENFDALENYYLFPIQPGVRNSLAGTMGELRSTHFHSGIDVRTGGRVGLPVHASADGSITRIAVSTSGYGNAIYILHPNGETTVYAHLDRFRGPVADYIRKEQYRRKTFKLNLYFREGQFKVNRGDTIAYSGNSGSSGGPHLHYDVRDKNQKPLNPLTYGFDEIVDTTPPVVRKLAIKALDINSRINGTFGRSEFTPRRIGNDYVIDKPIEVKGEIGIELYAYDILDNTRFRCGITSIVMQVDSVETFRQTIKTFSFGEQRNILAHMNYQDLYTTGARYHKLYVDDGNKLKFYKTNKQKGKLTIKKSETHNVSILMSDSYGNKSYFKFKVKYSDRPPSSSTTIVSKGIKSEIVDNTLIINAPNTQGANLSLWNADKVSIEPEYTSNGVSTYLWDMRKGLPETLLIDQEPVDIKYQDMVPSNTAYQFYNGSADISFGKNSLFDTLYLQTRYHYDSSRQMEVFKIGDPLSPLRNSITVTLKPENTYNNLPKTRVYFLNGLGNPSYIGGTWKSGKISFKTRKFGKYTLLEDSIPPKITPVRADRSNLRFKISDQLSGIEKFECTVNGKWVLMNYDHKRSLIWSEKLNKGVPFQG
ncbi:MAG: M23 family metallopeptidase, partial [Bacteroidota bacterium]